MHGQCSNYEGQSAALFWRLRGFIYEFGLRSHYGHRTYHSAAGAGSGGRFERKQILPRAAKLISHLLLVKNTRHGVCFSVTCAAYPFSKCKCLLFAEMLTAHGHACLFLSSCAYGAQQNLRKYTFCTNYGITWHSLDQYQICTR